MMGGCTGDGLILINTGCGKLPERVSKGRFG
jgi:hypothetical protein